MKRAEKASSGTSLSTSSPSERPGDFFSRVLRVVDAIPEGKVTTYGLIAGSLGLRSSARMVGYALNSAAGSGYPCHRVVNRFGALSGRMHFEGPFVMEERLRAEGIRFREDGSVDLEAHLWRPELPLSERCDGGLPGGGSDGRRA